VASSHFQVYLNTVSSQLVVTLNDGIDKEIDDRTIEIVRSILLEVPTFLNLLAYLIISVCKSKGFLDR